MLIPPWQHRIALHMGHGLSGSHSCGVVPLTGLQRMIALVERWAWRRGCVQCIAHRQVIRLYHTLCSWVMPLGGSLGLEHRDRNEEVYRDVISKNSFFNIRRFALR